MYNSAFCASDKMVNNHSIDWQRPYGYRSGQTYVTNHGDRDYLWWIRVSVYRSDEFCLVCARYGPSDYAEMKGMNEMDVMNECMNE